MEMLASESTVQTRAVQTRAASCRRLVRTWEQQVVVHKQVRLGAVGAGVFVHPHFQVAHVVLRASRQQHKV